MIFVRWLWSFSQCWYWAELVRSEMAFNFNKGRELRGMAGTLHRNERLPLAIPSSFPFRVRCSSGEGVTRRYPQNQTSTPRFNPRTWLLLFFITMFRLLPSTAPLQTGVLFLVTFVFTVAPLPGSPLVCPKIGRGHHSSWKGQHEGQTALLG